MDCMDPGHRLWVLLDGKNALLHATGTVTFLVASEAETLLEALSSLKRFSASEMPSGVVGVPQDLETREIERRI